MSTPVHMADALEALHCRVAFLSAAAWAFSTLPDNDALSDRAAWQGLAYCVDDVQIHLRDLVRVATPATWQLQKTP